MGRIGIYLLVLVGLGVSGCASPRIARRSEPASAQAPTQPAAPTPRTARVGERVPLSELIRCEATPSMWRHPRRDTLALTGEAETGGAPTCCLEEEECPPRHKINLFLGYTSERGDETGQTFGFDYEYRFNQTWGVGAFAEQIGGNINALAGGVGAYYHPTEKFFLFAGPGLDLVPKGKDEARLRGLLRIGAGYEFELGRGWTVGPAAYVDFIDVRYDSTPAFILGLNIGKGWGR